MLYALISILGIIITIFFVVGIHEFSHFLVARLVGVKVLRFSIGFGKALYTWHDKKGTEYVIAAIPLGGYVKMLDENEEEVKNKEDLPLAYNRQPVYKRIAIVLAGPISNLIFAFFIYWLLFVIGFTSIIPLIGKITPNSIAAAAHMQPNEEIISVNNNTTTQWDSIIVNLLMHAGNKDKIEIATKNIDTQQTHHYTLDVTNWHMNDLKPDPLDSLGITPYIPTIPAIVGKVYPNSAASSKLQVDDKIVSINKQPVKDWYDLVSYTDNHPDQLLNFQIERKGKELNISIRPHIQHDLFYKKHGIIGISPQFEWPKKLLRNYKANPILALSRAWENTKNFFNMNFLVLGKLLTGKLSFSSLGGPITIFQGAGTALNSGLLPFLSFLAFLSIAVGFINLLPIPGLDGGHLLFQFIELIARRPVPMAWQILFFRLGFILLLLLLSQALVNDIQRL